MWEGGLVWSVGEGAAACEAARRFSLVSSVAYFFILLFLACFSSGLHFAHLQEKEK